MTMNVFERASKEQWRYATKRGLISTEQLWQLPLSGDISLDAIAVGLHHTAESEKRVSFVSDTQRNQAAELAARQLTLVKHIIDAKLTAKAEREKARERSVERDKLLALLGRKEDEAMEGMEKDDILKRLKELD